MITLKNIQKSFKKRKVLHGVSLSIPSAACYALIGPSGSGKSTLLRCVNGLESPDAGTITIDKIELTPANLQAQRQSIGMVFQHFNLFEHFTVLENLCYAPRKLQKISRKAAEAKAHALLERVGLPDKSDAYPHSLSGGQKQRVAIARALMLNPKILLMDEPTSALDPESVRGVLDLIASLTKEGITMLITTHEMDFAKNCADSIVFLADGNILEQGPAKSFFDAPKNPRLKDFLGHFA